MREHLDKAAFALPNDGRACHSVRAVLGRERIREMSVIFRRSGTTQSVLHFFRDYSFQLDDEPTSRKCTLS